MSSQITRIAVFYDGNYFSHVSNYYNYVHQRKSRISISGLHDYIRKQISLIEDNDESCCKIVDAHFFKGRVTAMEASERGNQLYFDRVFEDILTYEGVTTHYQTVKGNVSTRSADKGLNLILALEALDRNWQRHFDVVVLIAADGDYAPLVNKLNGMGTRVMLLSWDFEFTSDDGKRMTTRTSNDLIKTSSYPLLMHDRIEEGIEDGDDIIQNLFVLPPPDQRERASRETIRTVADPLTSQDEIPGSELHTGTIMNLQTGYGFIRFEPNNLFFHHSSLVNVDFNDLFEGDEVQFVVAENEKGDLVAKQVTLVE